MTSSRGAWSTGGTITSGLSGRTRTTQLTFCVCWTTLSCPATTTRTRTSPSSDDRDNLMLHCKMITGKSAPSAYSAWVEAIVVVSFDIDEGRCSLSQARKYRWWSPRPYPRRRRRKFRCWRFQTATAATKTRTSSNICSSKPTVTQNAVQPVCLRLLQAEERPFQPPGVLSKILRRPHQASLPPVLRTAGGAHRL